MTDIRIASSLIAAGDFSKVRAATSLVQLFEEVTAVKRSGGRFTALCPFHDERSPSLSINEVEGLFHCFGCGASGDAITFVRETKGLGLRAATEYLADRAGIVLTYEESSEAHDNRIHYRKLHEAIERSIEFYQTQLFESPEGRQARDYLRERGWNGDLARQFKVGWAPANGEGAIRSLRIPAEVAYESGIGMKGEGGRPYDLLRGRLVFPIFEPGGKPVALAGRVMPGDTSPSKYVNFAETPLYQKRKIVYGLNWAKKAIAASDEVIVCEGYTDVISFYRVGLMNAVATCGVALTEEHIKLLRRFAKKIIVAYDADTAGSEGVQRLYKWESTHGVEFAVVTLDAGEDPASLVEDGRGEDLITAVKDAKPLLGWRVGRLLSSSDLITPEGRVLASTEAMSLVNAHPNQILRDLYAEVIADACGLDREVLRPKRAPVQSAASNRSASGTLVVQGPEYEVLKVAVHRPRDVDQWLIPQLFTEDLALRVFTILCSGIECIADAMMATDREAVALISKLDFEEADGDAGELRVRLVLSAVDHAIKAIMRDAKGKESIDEHLKIMTKLRSTSARANEEHDESAIQELWGWLNEQPVDLPAIEFLSIDLNETEHVQLSVLDDGDDPVIGQSTEFDSSEGPPAPDDAYLTSFVDGEEPLSDDPDEWL